MTPALVSQPTRDTVPDAPGNPAWRREEFGVAPIVKLLEGQLGPAVTSAAADAVRAIALNNDANKTALREAWALPQLVKLLLPEVGGRLSVHTHLSVLLFPDRQGQDLRRGLVCAVSVGCSERGC